MEAWRGGTVAKASSDPPRFPPFVRLYVRVYFHSDGESPLDVINAMKQMGFRSVFGDYDFSIDYDTPADYRRIVEQLHRRLKGTKASYALATKRH